MRSSIVLSPPFQLVFPGRGIYQVIQLYGIDVYFYANISNLFHQKHWHFPPLFIRPLGLSTQSS